MKRVMLFGALILIALAMVGVSSAAWSVPDLGVQGSVSMGTMDARFASASVFQFVPPTEGSVTVSLSSNGLVLTVNLPDSKKDYSALVMFSVQNEGTIPVKVGEILASAPNNVDVSTFGEGATIGPGESRTLFGLWISVSKKARLPAAVTVTLDCRLWLE